MANFTLLAWPASTSSHNAAAVFECYVVSLLYFTESPVSVLDTVSKSISLSLSIQFQITLLARLSKIIFLKDKRSKYNQAFDLNCLFRTLFQSQFNSQHYKC